MSYEIWIDPGCQRELDDLRETERAAVLSGVQGLAQHPLEHPQLVRLHGTRYPGSFRLRVGRFRVVGIVLDHPKLILLTTLFLKKRESDYVQAKDRHEDRLRVQGPPLDEYVRGARRRKS